ncbi:MAG: hypothetical protein GWN99_05105 [Gemmatimonadetes bacterium]|uniref:Uncharacterized protein n=1 Tax=Candidatus Kutchimonas denitrificans TaxID=3056748 RepID=A0AAE4ZAH9_9BACT|nr:hypothetical protein [Gemmatimonadota bacterium]NIR76063.1 hypothetical protein [Candidatus Kutchimonas denitrificans]NIS00442.1 hypothetical protein [Gemmatimonadota bacterium]NIT66100.1 hypothetical protein [Gemmatimonadota bacterium]NIU54178.1 hypothetical protein [Gemmatimonadota bacterium]
MIDVTTVSQNDPFEFQVTVKEKDSESQHRVTMGSDDYHKLGGNDTSPEECIEAAFRFLLDREPKESILGKFDVSVISRYFPEFRDKFPDYLKA